jgi:hypothetical protein
MALIIDNAPPAQAPFIVGALVYDEANPDQHGKIVDVGPEVSAVRFNGGERFISNVHLRAVDRDGLSQLNPSPAPVSDIVRRGQEAMERKRRGWDDWLAIAEALQAGRTEVMRELHTNEARGRRYEKAIGEWLISNGFKEIDKGTRSRLLECLEHKDAIEAWRKRLTDSERFAFNHPDTVLRKWKAATVVPDPTKPPKSPSPMQQLKDALVKTIEERDRYKRDVVTGGGDLWAPEDTPRDIAKVIIGKLTRTKGEKVAREILAAYKEADKLKKQREAMRALPAAKASP